MMLVLLTLSKVVLERSTEDQLLSGIAERQNLGSAVLQRDFQRGVFPAEFGAKSLGLWFLQVILRITTGFALTKDEG